MLMASNRKGRVQHPAPLHYHRSSQQQSVLLDQPYSQQTRNLRSMRATGALFSTQKARHSERLLNTNQIAYNDDAIFMRKRVAAASSQGRKDHEDLQIED